MTAEEYRKAFPKTHQLEVEPGRFFKVRRVSNTAMLAAGLIPTFFVSEVGRNWRRSGPQPASDDVSNIDQMEMAKLILAVVCEAAVEPRLVRGEPGEGELNVFEDVEDAHIMAIFNWAMTGARGAAVKMKGGEVEVDDLVNFHPDGERSAANDARAGGADVRTAPEPDARVAG
jgi:hypothetical protein